MKLQQVHEMAFKAPPFKEYSDDQLHQALEWLTDAKEITEIENTFSLITKSGANSITYAIKRNTDNHVLGWIILDPKKSMFGKVCYPLVIVYVLPKFRNTPVILMLINAVREVLDAPLYVDGAIFVTGQQLFNAVIQRNLVKASTVNKETGTITPYVDGDLKHGDINAFIFESTGNGFYGCYLPGCPEVRTYFNWYGDFHEEMLK